MWNLKGITSTASLITENSYSPSTSQPTACEHELLTIFWQVKPAMKMPWQKQWLYLTSLINCLIRLLWSSHHCFEELTIKRSLCPEKKLFSKVKTIHQLHRKYRSVNQNSLNCCLVKYAVYMLRKTTHHIKGNADPRKMSLLQLLLQEQDISPDSFS